MKKRNDLTKQRRGFFKKAAVGGLSLGFLMNASSAESATYAMQHVNRYSSPSDLKITDLRVAVVDKGGLAPIIRIDTNQGIYGLGEVRDGGSERYALFLKSRLLGKNPCNVEMLFKRIKQFGFHGRQGGGVSGVEMALWDLAGKAYNVPVYQLLGGKYRDKVRIYADTPMHNDPVEFAKVLNTRVKDQGYTFLKMDFGIRMLAKDPELVVNSNFWDIDRQWSMKDMSYGATEHPFTR
ncbi:MAG: mandelate racemase/muconate lactonizing enzyme family protein, partial [Bacteroidota bacterium]